MKWTLATGVLLSMLSFSAAADDCTSGAGTAITQTDLEEQVVCGTSATNSDTWQEHHGLISGGGVLTEFALGTNPVDPTHVVGSWSISGNTVTYTYSGGSSYSFDVYSTVSGAITFCEDTGTGTVATATLISSATPVGCD